MKRATTSEIRNHLATHLTPRRLLHTEGVRETARRFSKAHDLDLDLTERAALLHDVAKPLTLEQLLDACRRYDVPITDDDLRLPGVIHSYVGAAIAEHDFGLEADGCGAIRAHTTGWVPMGPLDMVLYVADFSEPGRAFAEADQIHELACVDLAAATIRTMALKLYNLLDRGAPIHPRAVTARNAMLDHTRDQTD